MKALFIINCHQKFSGRVEVREFPDHLLIKNIRLHDGNFRIRKKAEAFGLIAEYVGDDTYKVA